MLSNVAGATYTPTVTDVAGMVVTGTYSDTSTKEETVALSDVTGFDSSAVITEQTLTVTVGGKTTTYVISVEKAAGPEAPLVKNFNPHGGSDIIMLKKDGTSFRIKAGTNMIGYEYSIDESGPWGDLDVDTEITVEGETILIRAKETDTHNAGEAAKVLLSEGYVFNSNTGTILSYAGTATVLTIPNTIAEVNVTAIDDSSFGGLKVSEGKGLTSVTLPIYLERIGAFAFMNNELTSVEIPISVTFVNTQAFEKNKLIEVTIPSSVSTIGDQAFLYNGPNQDSNNITTKSPDFVGTWKVELEGESYVWKKQS